MLDKSAKLVNHWLSSRFPVLAQASHKAHGTPDEAPFFGSGNGRVARCPEVNRSDRGASGNGSNFQSAMKNRSIEGQAAAAQPTGTECAPRRRPLTIGTCQSHHEALR